MKARILVVVLVMYVYVIAIYEIGPAFITVPAPPVLEPPRIVLNFDEEWTMTDVYEITGALELGCSMVSSFGSSSVIVQSCVTTTKR